MPEILTKTIQATIFSITGSKLQLPRTPMRTQLPNILVVDDSKAILIVMKAIFNELEMPEVTTCLSAVTALEKVKPDINFYDAIFTDLNMPEMDGMELIRNLGEIGYCGAIVIISEMDPKIISLAADLAKQHNVHLIGNLTKPVQLNQVNTLLAKIAQLNSHTLVKERPITKAKLISALKNNEITPYYQPKININNNQIQSVEVLARIVSNKNERVILPSRFISLAEQCDLINDITFTLFEKACSDLKQLKEQLGESLKLSFNMSPCQLNDLNCPNKLLLLLQKYGVLPSDVVVEITEQHALSSYTQLETLNRFRIFGFGISLDDFGTGFTNINQLKQLPFTEVKIDRSFISHIETDKFSQVVVSSLINMTNQEQLQLVAEGVERPEELAYLKHYQTDLTIQGFLFSCPKAKAEFISWAQHWIKTATKTNNN